MRKKGKPKRLFSSYISKEVYDVMEYLIQREEVSKVVFIRRAINYFLDSEQYILPRVLINKRNDPEYIERSCLVTIYMEEEQREQLQEVVKIQGCTMSQVFFQVIIDYCSFLISLDTNGLEIS